MFNNIYNYIYIHIHVMITNVHYDYRVYKVRLVHPFITKLHILGSCPAGAPGSEPGHSSRDSSRSRSISGSPRDGF